MKTKRNFTMLTATLAIAALGISAWAAPPTPPTPPAPPAPPAAKESGLIGTWYGHAGSSLKWLGIQTAGSTDAKNGEMLLNWVSVSGDLLWTGTTEASSLTPGHGVWQEISKGNYNYTWYAFGIDSSGNPVFSIRVKGLATNTDNDNVAISYTYDVFAPAVLPQNMSTSTPLGPAITGPAEETRVPLVTP